MKAAQACIPVDSTQFVPRVRGLTDSYWWQADPSPSHRVHYRHLNISIITTASTLLLWAEHPDGNLLIGSHALRKDLFIHAADMNEN